jgi:tRNA threonylcarbamoyladenosine biosynthesis protein TsaE
MNKLLFSSVVETRAFGEALGRHAQPGDLLLLEGGLGAGKTELARGLANGLGCKHEVRSPTFNLIHAYDTGRLPLYHLDLYRIEETSELIELGLDEVFGDSAVAVVEWSERLAEFTPGGALRLRLRYLDHANARQADCECHGERACRWLSLARGEEQ